MTNKTNHDHYKAQRDKQNNLKLKAMKSLTVDQLDAIKKTHKTVADCLAMLRDCNDLYVSDVGKLESIFWELQNQFVLENDE